MANTQNFGNAGTFTITLASLASNALAGRQSNELDLSTISNIHDLQISLEVTLPAGTAANDMCVYLTTYGSLDGTNYPSASGNAIGASDAAVTNLAIIPGIPIIILPIGTGAGALTYKSQPISIAQTFGGTLPKKVVVGVRNYCGITLTSGTVRYTPIYYN